MVHTYTPKALRQKKQLARKGETMGQDKLQSACCTLIEWLMDHEGFKEREPWMEAVNAIGIRAKYEAEHLGDSD